LAVPATGQAQLAFKFIGEQAIRINLDMKEVLK
jgi:hypothetical protein